MDKTFSALISFFVMLNDLINPIYLFFVGLISGLLAFIVAIVVMFLFRKKILVKRKYVILRIFSYLYLFFIPLLVAFVAASWFTVNSAQKEMVKNLPAFLNNETFNINAQINETVLKTFDEESLNQSLGDILDKAEIQSKQELVQQKIKYNWANGNKIDALINYFILNHPQQFRKYVVEIANNRLGDNVMSKDVAHQVLDENILALLDKGVVTKYIEFQIVKIMKGFKIKILLSFLVLMLFPISEILYANRAIKRLSIENLNQIEQ